MHAHVYRQTGVSKRKEKKKKQKKTNSKNNLRITDVQTHIVDAREAPHC